MKIEIEANFKITGENLYEIADGLTKIAGEMLIARILQKGQEVVKTHTAPPPGMSIKFAPEEVKK